MTAPENSASMRRPRIVHLLPCLYLGGAEQHVLRLVKAMSSTHEFALVAPDGPGQILFDPAVVPRRAFRRLEFDALTGFSSVRRALAAEAAARPIDIVHVHIESALLYFARAVLPTVPRIYTGHGIVGMAAAKYWITSRVINRWADLTCLVSAHDLDRFRKSGADVGRLRLIPNGVDAPVSSEAGRAAMARRLGLREGDAVVGALSRLEPEKGIDVLVDAAAELAARVPSLRVVIAGSGSQETKLRQRIAARGLGDRVSLVGFVSEVGDFLSCLDVYVQPSRSESSPLSVVEAMAMSLPVVASRVGGVPEQVGQRQTGLLVPPDDPKALAEAIEAILADAALRRQMGVAAQQKHAAHFSLRTMVDGMSAIYDEAMAPERMA